MFKIFGELLTRAILSACLIAVEATPMLRLWCLLKLRSDRIKQQDNIDFKSLLV